MNLLNNFLFVALPYVAIAVFLIGAIYRYMTNSFTYSALSSQFLEQRGVGLAALLFHWGILALLALHTLAFLFPSAIMAWNSDPMRLVIHETLASPSGFASSSECSCS